MIGAIACKENGKEVKGRIHQKNEKLGHKIRELESLKQNLNGLARLCTTCYLDNHCEVKNTLIKIEA